MSTTAWPEIPSAAWSRAVADVPPSPPRPKIEGQFDGGPLPGVLAAWFGSDSPPDGRYHALFPKSWYHYPAGQGRPVDLLCEQFSPVMPGNYRETSYPVAVFRWWLRNPGDKPAEAAILFSLANMVGWFDDMGRGKPYRRNAGNFNRAFRAVAGDGEGAPAAGVVFDHIDTRSPPAEGNGQMAIGTRGGPSVTLSTHAGFDARGDGAEVWTRFAADGTLGNDGTSWIVGADFAAESTGLTAGAVAAKLALAPGQTATLTFALAWDLPVVRFGAGREHWRRYTRFWGRGGDHAMVRAALADHENWSHAIDRWHAEVIGEPAQPDWRPRLLLNELYLVVDGRAGDARNQTNEVLVGLNVSFAVQLRHYGLAAEADAVLQAIHNGIYRDRALWFRTPAAWDRDAPTFRSIMNMRPLGVWMLWLDGGGRPYV